MKKKLIALLAAAMMVLFGMASMASAATVCEGDDPCDFKCGKWTVGDIPINECSTVQGQVVTSIPAFDFEWKTAAWPGYCAGTHSFETLIYSVCCCDTTALEKLDPNAADPATIRFVVEILTDGVYFGDKNLSEVEAAPLARNDGFARFQQYNTLDDLCDAAEAGQIWQVNTLTNPYVVMNPEVYNADEALDAVGVAPTNMVSIDANGEFECLQPSWAYCNKVQYSRDVSTGLRLTVDQLWQFINGSFYIESSYLAFDLPSFAYKNTVVSEGDVVRVKVSIEIFERDCPVCTGTWTEICSCTKTIGTFVEDCNVQAATEKCFPYVTGPDFGDNWWTGIAVSNMSDDAQAYTVNVFIAGQTGSFTVNVPANTVQTFMLSDYRAELSGLDLTQNGYVQVSCENGKFDGFAMVGDQTQGMGYLPRCGACGTCN